jgi:hypothetical protein
VRRLLIAVEAALVVAAAALALLDIPAPLIERWFSTGLYPRIQRLLTPLTNLTPFAWLDILVLAVAAAVLIALVRAIRRAWTLRQWQPVLLVARRLAVTAAALYLCFLFVWGFNYRRVAMGERLVLDRPAPTSDAVAALGAEAVDRLNALHDDAHRIGWRDDIWRDEPLRAAFGAAQGLLADAPAAAPGRLKRTLFGTYFRWASVDGMVNPFGLEVLGNPDLLPFERPFVIAHEWAHLAGYAHEAEANFVGWLTCLRGDVPAQYSAWIFLYWQVSGELGNDDRDRVNEKLGEGPRRDLNAIVERLRRGQLPAVRRAGWAVYDQYLKANRVDEGVRSYGEALILRARFSSGWTPVRRF